jgi:hypothetical protein
MTRRCVMSEAEENNSSLPAGRGGTRTARTGWWSRIQTHTTPALRATPP